MKKGKPIQSFSLPPDPEGYRLYLRKQLARRKWKGKALEMPEPLAVCPNLQCSCCGEPSEFSGGLIAGASEELLCRDCWQEQNEGVTEASEGNVW